MKALLLLSLSITVIFSCRGVTEVASMRPIREYGRYKLLDEKGEALIIEISESWRHKLRIRLWSGHKKVVDDTTNASTYHKWCVVIDQSNGLLWVESSDIGTCVSKYRTSATVEWPDDDLLELKPRELEDR